MGEQFEKICSTASLESALQRVLKKNAAGGLDALHPHDITPEKIPTLIADIRGRLLAKTYIPVPYAKGAIPKFNAANEWRSLAMPSVIDKIVQQSFVDCLSPVFEKDFLDCSYAYRQGKGPVAAIKRVEHIISHLGAQCAVAADIDNFFDSINHELLMQFFRQKVDEPELGNLIDLWLHAGIVSRRGEWDQPDEGIAQGSVVSPLFSNIYLHRLDTCAADSGFHYVRYSDNFIALAESRDQLYIAYERLKAFLETDLRLKLNNDPYPFKDLGHGFAFLGVYFKNAERCISTGKETKIFRKINWNTEKAHQREPESFLKRLNESVTGTVRYYSFISPVRQFRAFDQHLLKRLEAVLAGFREKGLLTTREDMLAFIQRVALYAERSPQDHRDVCAGLAAAVLRAAAAGPAGKPVTDAAEQAARARRITATKNRYLKRVADSTELIVSSPGMFIGKTGGTIVVREQRRNVLEIPFSKITSISVMSRGASFSSDIVLECASRNVPMTFYNFKGMPCAMVQSAEYPAAAVSVIQAKAYETSVALDLTKKILQGKSRNQMNLLKFYLRHRRKTLPDFAGHVEKNLASMEAVLEKLMNISLDGGGYPLTRDKLFSAEARISALYWDCMKQLVPPELGFERRNRHDARDLVNMLLNYGYGILYNRVWRAVIKSGLNPHISFLHAFQPKKPTLIYDLVEEYRQPFVDRAVFSLLSRGKKGADLTTSPEDGFLSKASRDVIARAVIARLSALVAYRDKKIKAEDIIDHQVRAVVAWLEGRKTYQPYIAGY